MKILVTAKRVTDPDAKLTINDDASWIEDDVEYILNHFCENAIEGALQLAESQDDVETIAIGIGDDEAQRFIRQGALARGVDRGIFVEAEEEDIDSDLIAKILKAIVEKEEPDIVMLGKQAIDGDSNQVGQLLAEYLGWPQACFASEISIEGDEVHVVREVDGGLETVAITTPCVITADLRLNEPRYASLAGIMKAKKKPLDEYDLDDLELDDEEPKVRVVALSTPAGRSAGQMVADVDELISKLTTEARVL
jgi:electron transfer flavoprotein beta subunit